MNFVDDLSLREATLSRTVHDVYMPGRGPRCLGRERELTAFMYVSAVFGVMHIITRLVYFGYAAAGNAETEKKREAAH